MKIITGIQPTNNLHIGNLFGALLPALQYQDKEELIMMIVDYHAITVPQNPHDLYNNILFAAASYLACGLDPKKTILFQQSAISAHTELGWIMQTIAYMGEAQRMTQFKDKSQNNTKAVSVGLFTYPMLMAADILLYDAEKVPVGEDQKQHLELTRNLAIRFNNRFGEIFTIPEPIINNNSARILSLSNPEKKMSKSDPAAKSYILLTDEPALIRKKIMSAVTDSERIITTDNNRRGLHNLLTIFSLVSGKSIEELANEYETSGMKVLKENLADALIEYLKPIKEKINDYLADKAELERILKNGANSARPQAEAKLNQIKKALGLYWQ
ncbi:tryptophan--tRNA ligase [Candidatus Parcubacteria bacterium]|nr:MAG: tryptophan--tRNA ligase [Candidatus Parcubacteria bacterium]